MAIPTWSWSEKQHQRWAAVRSQGRIRYAIYTGVLGYGLTMFLLLAVGPKVFNFPFPARPSPTYWIWQPFMWLALGLLWGFGTWYFNERSFLTREAKTPTHSIDAEVPAQAGLRADRDDSAPVTAIGLASEREASMKAQVDPSSFLEITWPRVVRIWWAFFWRSMLLSIIAGGLIGATFALVSPAFGVSVRSINPNVLRLVGFLPMIPIGVCVMRYVLNRRWPGFRIALIPLDSA